MKIEIGKQYKLEPTYKKSVVDVERLAGEHGEITVTTVWRWGSWYVIPVNENEVELLTKALTENISLCITAFEDYEMIETWDVCSEDLEYISGDWTDERFEKFQEEYFEDGYEVFEKYDFNPTDCETYIECEVTLEEAE